MKNCLLLSIFLIGICTGCTSQSTQPVKGTKHEAPDYMDRKVRNKLQAEPIPFPKDTPYDADLTLCPIYLKGFKRGWEVVVTAWLGSLIVVPSEFAHNEPYEKAWLDGYRAGVDAVIVRMDASHNREK